MNNCDTVQPNYCARIGSSFFLSSVLHKYKSIEFTFKAQEKYGVILFLL